MIGSASFGDEVFARGHGSFATENRAQELDFGSREDIVTFKIEKERLDHERLPLFEPAAENRLYSNRVEKGNKLDSRHFMVKYSDGGSRWPDIFLTFTMVTARSGTMRERNLRRELR